MPEFSWVLFLTLIILYILVNYYLVISLTDVRLKSFLRMIKLIKVKYLPIQINNKKLFILF